MKKYFNLFLFISLLFLLISLYRSNYLKIPQIVSYPELIASIVLLLNGFLLDALCWKKTLDFHQYRISLRMGVVSVGLTIFGKYIPGKIWTALGRSSYLARRNVGNGGDVVYISFIAQLMLIWTGLIVGCVSLFTLQLPLSMIFGIIVLLCGLPALILSRPFHNAMSALIAKYLKDVKSIFPITMKKILGLSPYFFIRWTVFSLAYYLFVKSLTALALPVTIGFCFPMAGVLGLIAVFAPGGVGVREGIMALLLLSAGVAAPLAATVSVASRLWYLTGEVLIFITALLVRKSEVRN